MNFGVPHILLIKSFFYNKGDKANVDQMLKKQKVGMFLSTEEKILLRLYFINYRPKT